MKKLSWYLLLFSMAILVTACQSGQDAAGAAVETYLQALADENQERLSTTSCAEWEKSAILELDAFKGVSARLNEVVCQQTSMDGETAIVTCSGSIEATYNNELRQLPLEQKAFRVVEDQGVWLVCGYQE